MVSGTGGFTTAHREIIQEVLEHNKKGGNILARRRLKMILLEKGQEVQVQNKAGEILQGVFTEKVKRTSNIPYLGEYLNFWKEGIKIGNRFYTLTEREENQTGIIIKGVFYMLYKQERITLG